MAKRCFIISVVVVLFIVGIVCVVYFRNNREFIFLAYTPPLNGNNQSHSYAINKNREFVCLAGKSNKERPYQMQTPIYRLSIPDDVYNELDRLAKEISGMEELYLSYEYVLDGGRDSIILMYGKEFYYPVGIHRNTEQMADFIEIYGSIQDDAENAKMNEAISVFYETIYGRPD